MNVVINGIKDDIVWAEECIVKENARVASQRDTIEEMERNIIGWQEHIVDAKRVLEIFGEDRHDEVARTGRSE